MEDKPLRLMGLARRARRVETGEEPVGIACRAQKARLLVLASDAADHTARRAQSYCHTGKPLIVRIPYTKEQIGASLGLGLCAMCCFTDPALALAFVQSLGEDEAYAAAREELARQTARVTKRRQEEKAHRNNIKHGKK